MDIELGIDFKNEAIASIDRMMEEVLDDHDVNFFDALQNATENIIELTTVNDVNDICCEFYYVMDENERVMHREFFEKLKKYRESKIKRIVPLKEKDCIVMGNKYVELGSGKECVVDSVIHMLADNDRMIKDAVLYVDHLGQRIACSADEFRKKFGVRK
jgi:hypothetical protein|nr:MAG TPA: hypothetical protein [Caudoviricetes sp.]